MKIRPLAQSMDFLERVQDRRNGDTASGNPQGQNPYLGNENKRDPEPDSKEVEAAVDAFREDSQTKEQGLTAHVEGQGPGLRVILCDRDGLVLRECTGSQFIKLRLTLSAHGHASGKLLDQKV